MLTSKTSFKKRLILTGISLFAIVLLAATAIYLASRQYSFYLERSSRAQNVYSSYLAVSDHTYRKLSAMGEIVADGYLVDIAERYRNQEALRAALQKVRESIDVKLGYVSAAEKATELKHLSKIEVLAEQIISGSRAVRTAVAEEDRRGAIDALNTLRSEAIEGQFNSLIDQALDQELQAVKDTQRVTQKLSDMLNVLVPSIMMLSLFLVAALLYATWLALTKSLKEFKHAAESYKGGDFDHRISQVDEAEFADLAGTLNQMAEEVSVQRARERESQDNLESLVKLRTQELERSNIRLKEVSETRKQFLADISHELRTPLTIIQGESDVALRGEKKTPAQYIDAISRVKEQVVHTTRLVQDLLFVARTEDGKAPIHKTVQPLIPLVQDICTDFRLLSSARNINIVASYADTDIIANVDEGKIKQVVTILLDNAVRYSFEDSTIKVNVRQQGDSGVFEVVDTGIGLDDYEATKVFSRFYRGSEGMAAASGTGLGLPVAKAIVDAHGGTITLQGKKGQGTTATVILPIEKQLRLNT